MANEKLQLIKNALEDKMGKEILVLDITEVSSLTDYFMIVHGANVPQVQAMADNVEEKMLAAGYHARTVEGYQSAEWILMDYEDVIVHIFHQEKRHFYDLERLWKDGKTIEL